MLNSEQIDYEILIRREIDDPSVSVIVPIYNMGKNGFLVECLDSLVRQEASDLEIVCVDDASTDNSVDIACQYAERHQNISVLRLFENSRQGAACNRGVSLAKGRYIGFVDADDYVSPDFYSSLLANAEKTGADIIEAAFQRVSDSGHLLGVYGYSFPDDCLTEADVIRDELELIEVRRKVILQHPSPRFCIQRTSVVKKHGHEFLEGMRYEDTPVFLRWIYDFNSFSRSKSGRYYYRQHENSTLHSTAHDAEKLSERLRSAEMILRDAKRLEKYDVYKKSLDQYFLDVYLFNTVALLINGGEGANADMIRTIAQSAREYVPEYRKVIWQRRTSIKSRIAMLLLIEYPTIYLTSRALLKG